MRLGVLSLLAGLLLGPVVGSPAPATPATSRTVPDLRVSEPPSAGVPERRGHSRRHGPPQLRREGRWLVDPQGRVVIVHGLNLVYKRKPYVPPDSPTGFTARDAAWLARHGFDAARVGTLWAGLTPSAPGQADPAYLDQWQRVLDLLASKHIWIQLDMHQDQWHEEYGGEGVPDWAATRQLPYRLTPPLVASFPTGYWTPEVSSMFDDFWANRRGLLDGWLAAWRVAVTQWRDQRYLMGYDLLNEPWMGLEWPTCLVNGCPASYPTELQPAMEAGLRTVRALDPDNIVWWEPQQFAGGQAVDTYFTAPPGEDELGFSWHNYCPAVFLQSLGLPGGDVSSCRAYTEGREQHALDQAQRMDAVPMMSEWGATDDLAAIRIDAASADKHLMGWTHWAYKYWDDPTTADHDQGLFTDDTNLTSLKQGKARLLVRTYAQAVAGTPQVMRFHPGSGRFWFRYAPKPAITAPTRIFVSPLHYPHGYRVSVTHGTYRRAGRYVLVRASSPHEVSVLIQRR